MAIQKISSFNEDQSLVALQAEINELKAALEEQNQKVNAAMALYIQEQGQNERLNEIIKMGNPELKANIEEFVRANEALVKENKLIKEENALLKGTQIDKDQLHAAQINTLTDNNAELVQINQKQKNEIADLRNKEAVLINVYTVCKDSTDIYYTYGGGALGICLHNKLNIFGNMSQAVAAVDPYYPGLWTRKWQ